MFVNRLPIEEVPIHQGRSFPRQRHERIVGILPQLEPLSIHQAGAELRDEGHVPPHADAKRRPKYGPPGAPRDGGNQARQPDREQGRRCAVRLLRTRGPESVRQESDDPRADRGVESVATRTTDW